MLPTALIAASHRGHAAASAAVWTVVDRPYDVLVKVLAVALNPVDFKIKNGRRKGGASDSKTFEPRKILGFDAAGVVEAAGSQVHFKPGDEVFYAGNIARDGSYQQWQLVDGRLAALKPRSLSFAEAASLPLTAITAWEALREELNVQPGHSILITAGAGGVGSIATQLAKHWGLTVIASASRPETAQWCREHGADVVVDHKVGIAEEFKAQGLAKVKYVFNTFSDALLPDVVSVVDNFGAICGINGDIKPEQTSSIAALFLKRVKYCSEYMFAKAVYGVNEQSVGDLLGEVAALVDAGKLSHTMHAQYSWHDVVKAFEYLESRSVLGKVVMTIDENAESGGSLG